MFGPISDGSVEHRNRRLALGLVAALAALYCIAVVGVIVLN